MKTFIVLSLLIFSSLAHSQMLASNNVDDVIQAIKASLVIKDLDCVDPEFDSNFESSRMKWDVVSGGDLTINENQQPVIVLHKINPSKSNPSISYDIKIEVTTNLDYTQVEKIYGTSYTNTMTKVNTGTIINPKYEDKVVSSLGEEVVCQ